MTTPSTRRRQKRESASAIRARRAAEGLCLWCGEPAPVRVTLDAGGREVERRTLRLCRTCRP